MMRIGWSDRRMSGREFICCPSFAYSRSGCSRNTLRAMPPRIAHLHHRPLAIPILQRVRHRHTVIEVFIILRMKRYGRVR